MATVHIPKPCHEDWERMSPNQRGRHCAVCDKTVVDVTRMTPSAGRTFIAEELPRRLAAGAHLCVRAHADLRGRLLAPGITRRLLTNGLAAVLAMTIAGCQGEGPTVTSNAGTGSAQGPAQTTTPVQRGGQGQAVPRSGPQLQGEPTVELQPMPGLVAPLRVQPPPVEPVKGDAKPVARPAQHPMQGAPAPVPHVECVKGEIAVSTGDVAIAPAPRSTAPAPQPDAVGALSGKPTVQAIDTLPQDAPRR
jgi:hypothetical protein